MLQRRCTFYGLVTVTVFLSMVIVTNPDTPIEKPEEHCFFIDMNGEKTNLDIFVNPNTTTIIVVKLLANVKAERQEYGNWPNFAPPDCRNGFMCIGFDNISPKMDREFTLKIAQNDVESTIRLNTPKPRERNCNMEEKRKVTSCCDGRCDCKISGGIPISECHDGSYGKCCDSRVKPQRVRKQIKKGCLSGTVPCEVRCSEIYEDPEEEKSQKVPETTHESHAINGIVHEVFERYTLLIFGIMIIIISCILLIILCYFYRKRSHNDANSVASFEKHNLTEMGTFAESND